MIALEDRQTMVRQIESAHADAARLRLACEVAGINVRTLQRWKAHAGRIIGDRRPCAERLTPGHALSKHERILAVANEPRFAVLPPAWIVPMLADENVYIASESSVPPHHTGRDGRVLWSGPILRSRCTLAAIAECRQL